mmetsp:Transcript_25761/g.39494  ORF Transcript_25761/g.39494 Transcript_25761/m.39494 type:complete len:595 (+) Transcript_25761:144-1928(+)|eukprot:CAMPEP_0118677834 /NCGR_PEP_ID=MMETSP0800-20121206/2857_1 /TAXON_ID=210618 ORGANISM="Striatella unipunctata, Strain CCMP2910" /NCGR_SAMPLE_ID=MMETSP0800 /ASSEMBLY_ACC=CAM_ASM_000638 /LENGTH=594 /DNA_ID=CAMNT_0006573571 /DNA_START=212 /DNA_END=1996 /DNA_ORIENTATION=-
MVPQETLVAAPLHHPPPTTNIVEPVGFQNWGNTCYANATLQCLLSTALTHALLDPETVVIFRRYSSNPTLLQVSSKEETDEEATTISMERRRQDRKREKEAMHETCKWLTDELTRITKAYASGSRKAMKARKEQEKQPAYMSWVGSTNASGMSVVDPGSITRYPHKLSKCLRPYQQEDAHEFLRALLSTLVMNGHNKQLSSLFDGLLESAVTCQTCQDSSLTRDRYMDLSLDISHDYINSLERALREFTKTETLGGDNKVYCEKCDCKQVATKGLRLATAPSILVCHLKRFACDPYGRLIRLGKHIKFPLRLEIGDYMSKANRSRPPPYSLVAVLVHQGGHRCDTGHYLAYVRSSSNPGRWYKANDSVVTQVDEETVLAQSAYMLIYEVADMLDNHGLRPKMVDSVPAKSVLKRDEGDIKEISSIQSGDSDESETSFSASLATVLSMLTLCAPTGTSTLDALDHCCSSALNAVDPKPEHRHRQSKMKRGNSYNEIARLERTTWRSHRKSNGYRSSMSPSRSKGGAKLHRRAHSASDRRRAHSRSLTKRKSGASSGYRSNSATILRNEANLPPRHTKSPGNVLPARPASAVPDLR